MVLRVFGIGITAAQESDDISGGKVIAGRVYKSNGEVPEGDYEGAYAAVIVEHDNFREDYLMEGGLIKADDGTYWYLTWSTN